ncbi:unnamed protein product [Victoria cruziana]
MEVQMCVIESVISTPIELGKLLLHFFFYGKREPTRFLYSSSPLLLGHPTFPFIFLDDPPGQILKYVHRTCFIPFLILFCPHTV